MKKYCKLLRVKHYIKNILIFFPCIFSGRIFEINTLKISFISFLIFCAVSSTVYIINDIKDVEKDRLHPKKCKRPIASGEVSIKQAVVLATVCFTLAIVGQLFLRIDGHINIAGLLTVLAYFIINVLYSVCGWKNIPLVDVAILTSGFILRVFFGAVNTDIAISSWLYLVIFCGALFMGFGKRKNELKICGNNTRKVLERYSLNFLDKSMQTSITLSIVFYSLWCMERAGESKINFLISVPLFVFILLKYSMDIDGESDGDPVNVILGDKILIVMVVILAFILMWGLYM